MSALDTGLAGTSAVAGASGRITLHFDGDFDLDLAEVFPDGAPVPVTVDDVAAAVATAGGPLQLIAQWGFDPAVSVSMRAIDSGGVEHRAVWS